MYKQFINIVACLLLSVYAFGQPIDDNAYAGLRAVFVFHGFAPASPKFPDAAGNTGFTLQRREGPAASWITVRPFNSPQNLQELIANYNIALALLPDAKRISFDPVEAWGKWEKYKSYDSILNELSYAPGQMAFNVLVADSTVRAGKTYQYRIIKNVISAPLDSSFVSNAVPFPASLKIPAPKFMQRQTGRDMIMISWFAMGFKTVDNFNVYRAEGNNRFTLVKPGIRVVQHQDSTIYTLMDKNVVMGEMYQYFIKPVNGFSGGGNIVSDTVPATCMDPQHLQTPQDIYTTEDIGRRAIVVHYRLPDPAFIGSVHVFRSEHFDRGFAELGIVGATDTSYVDLKARAGIKYYYYLQMTDKMGRNSPRSIKTAGLYQDTANIQIPRYAAVRNGRDGIVVTWENPPLKEDISGYYVYRSVGAGGSDFQRISELLPVADSLNSYTDTAKILTPGMLYTYCIKSENLSNKLSRNSNMARIAIAAAQNTAGLYTPRNLKALVDSSNVRLIWSDMRAVNNSLAYYRVSRKKQGDKDFTVMVEKLPGAFSSWLDTTIQAGQVYEYAVESADDAGNMSAQATSNSIRLRQDALPAPIVTLFKTTDGISLNWDTVMDARVHGYNVYRYTKGTRPEKIGHAGATESSYTDKSLTAGTMYYYYVEPDAGNAPVRILQSNRVYVTLGGN